MKDLEKFEAAIGRVDRTLRVVREGERKDSVRTDFFNSMKSESSKIRGDLKDLADSLSGLPREFPQIPEIDLSDLTFLINKVENLGNAINSIKIPPQVDNSDKIIDHIKAIPAEVIEVPVIVEKSKVIEVEKVSEVEPVRGWHFKVIREGGVITDVEARADG
jgi:hypothetical protein